MGWGALLGGESGTEKNMMRGEDCGGEFELFARMMRLRYGCGLYFITKERLISVDWASSCRVILASIKSYVEVG